MLVVWIAPDQGFLWSFKEKEHEIVIDCNDGGNNCNDIEGGLDEEESGDKDDDIFEDIEDAFDDDKNLLIILDKILGTWLNLSAINGACDCAYHLMGLLMTAVRDFS